MRNKRESSSKIFMWLSLWYILLIAGLAGFIIGRWTAKECDDTPVSETSTQTVEILRIVAPSKVIPPITEEPITEEPVTEEPTMMYYDVPLDHDLQEYIRALCDKNDMPMSLVIGMISVESSFRPDVISRTNDYGLMQINEVNHKGLSEEYGITDFLDPYQNVFCGITILSQHYDKYQDLDKALMAYNLGATGAKRMWDKGIYETTYTNEVRAATEVYDNEIK